MLSDTPRNQHCNSCCHEFQQHSVDGDYPSYACTAVLDSGERCNCVLFSEGGIIPAKQKGEQLMPADKAACGHCGEEMPATPLLWPTEKQIDDLTDRVWKSGNVEPTGDFETAGHLRQYAMAIGLAYIASRGTHQTQLQQALRGGGF